MARRGDDGRADQLAQYIRDVVVDQLQPLQIAAAHDGANLIDLIQVVLGKVLGLNDAPRPAPGARCAVVLQRAPDAAVRACGVQHGGVLFRAALAQHLPEGKHALRGRVDGPLHQIGHGLLIEALRRKPPRSQPRFELAYAVGVLQPGELLHLRAVLCLEGLVHMYGLLRQCAVDQYAALVDARVQAFHPSLGRRELRGDQAIKDFALGLGVTPVVLLEQRPLLWGVLREIARAAAVRLGGRAGLAEVANQRLACVQLLLLQLEGGARRLQRHGQAVHGGQMHGVHPLHRRAVDVKGLVHAGALELAVVGDLDDVWVGQRPGQPRRQAILREIPHLHGVVAECVGHEQNLEVRRFDVAEHAVLDVLAGVGLQIEEEVVLLR